MQFESVKAVENYLNNIPKFQSVGSSAAKFDLNRFKEFCSFSGNPQRKFSAIHVAGTNGKGSTCHIIAAILREAGYKTGVYTSPHIIDYRERFRIDNQYISEADLLTFFNKFRQAIQEYQLSYFEISTALAFWWFAQSGIDTACIEVGLGGRLDATNIIDPLVSVITSIALDHTDILGETLQEIAQEKAGIIKNGRPVVIGDLPEAARKVIIQIAEDKQAPVITIDALKPAFIETGHFQLTVGKQVINLKSNLTAPIQAKNIAVAWQVFQQIEDSFPITEKEFINGLKYVKAGFGRFEKLSAYQQWYFDGGHNLQAIQALKQAINTVADIGDATLVLSMMKDKLRKDVMTEFSEFKNIYYYPLSLERAATFDDINRWLPKATPFPVSDENRKQLFQNDFDSELVIFSGSFYFYKAVRDWVSIYVLNR